MSGRQRIEANEKCTQGGRWEGGASLEMREAADSSMGGTGGGCALQAPSEQQIVQSEHSCTWKYT